MRSAYAVLAMLFAACSGGPDGVDGGRLSDGGAPADARVDAPFDASSCGHTVANVTYVAEATPSPDGAGWCCAAGRPSCECTPLGAFEVNRCDCDRHAWGVCDAPPPDWIRGTDAHGCTVYTTRFSELCCGCPPDAGPPDGG